MKPNSTFECHVAIGDGTVYKYQGNYPEVEFRRFSEGGQPHWSYELTLRWHDERNPDVVKDEIVGRSREQRMADLLEEVLHDIDHEEVFDEDLAERIMDVINCPALGTRWRHVETHNEGTVAWTSKTGVGICTLGYTWTGTVDDFLREWEPSR